MNSTLRGITGRVALVSGLFIAAVIGAAAQETQEVPKAEARPKPILLDEIADVGDCELGLRVKRFAGKLSDNPSYQGYIINYESAKGPPDLATRERLITNQIAFRNYDRSRITLVRGGFRLEISTELWMVPPDAENPAPSATLPDQDTADPETFLYDTRYPNEVFEEFVLPSVRKHRASEEMESFESEPRTAQEVDEYRYQWVPLGLASRLSIVETTATGLIRFYADDRTYDITRLTAFVDSARARLGKYGRIDPRRFRVEFGGFRPSPQVEFWVVRAGASAARVRAYERCENPDQ